MSGTIKRSNGQALVMRRDSYPAPHLRPCWHSPSPSPRQPGEDEGAFRDSWGWGRGRVKRGVLAKGGGGGLPRLAFVERNTNETDQDRSGGVYNKYLLTWSGILMHMWKRYAAAERGIDTVGRQCRASGLLWRTHLRFSQCAVVLIWTWWVCVFVFATSGCLICLYQSAWPLMWIKMMKAVMNNFALMP